MMLMCTQQQHWLLTNGYKVSAGVLKISNTMMIKAQLWTHRYTFYTLNVCIVWCVSHITEKLLGEWWMLLFLWKKSWVWILILLLSSGEKRGEEPLSRTISLHVWENDKYQRSASLGDLHTIIVTSPCHLTGNYYHPTALHVTQMWAQQDGALRDAHFWNGTPEMCM